MSPDDSRHTASMVFSPERLAALRLEHCGSRSDLYRALVQSGYLGCRSMIDRFENARSEPSASEVWLIACVLGVPIDALFEKPAASAP